MWEYKREAWSEVKYTGVTMNKYVTNIFSSFTKVN